MSHLSKVVVVALASAGTFLVAAPASAAPSSEADCTGQGGVISRSKGTVVCTTTVVDHDSTEVSQHSVLEAASPETSTKFFSTFVYHSTTTTTTTVADRRGKAVRTSSTTVVSDARNLNEQCFRATFRLSGPSMAQESVQSVDLDECASRAMFDWPLAWGS